MEVKLAKENFRADTESANITFDEMYQAVKNNKQRGIVFYLDRDNSEKVIKKMENFFNDKQHSVFVRELKYSMDTKDYVYEVHIL